MWVCVVYERYISNILPPSYSFANVKHSLGQTMPPTSNALRDIAAYVPQHEQFFPNQTPEEAVEFVANLKLGEDTREGVRKQRISQILDLVGIPLRARNRAIGGTLESPRLCCFAVCHGVFNMKYRCFGYFI